MLRRHFASGTTSAAVATAVSSALCHQQHRSAASDQQQDGGATTRPQRPDAFAAVPPYRKPPPAPVNAHVPTHLGGGTHETSDPYARKMPNQPLRAPESSVLLSQQAAAFTEDEMANPRLLADRRLPLGEWLRNREQVVATGAAASPSSSSSTVRTTPLALYLSSLAVPYKPIGPKQQQVISRFEEETIAEACTSNSREPNIEKTRWHSVVRKFTEKVYLFDADRFLAQLEALRQPVMSFFDSGSKGGGSGGENAFGAELEEVFEILCDNAKAVRNSKLKELGGFVSSAALEEGGLVWERFFQVVDTHKNDLIAMSSSSGNSSNNSELVTEQLTALWELSSSESEPPHLSPSLALLFVTVTALGTSPKAPDLCRLLEQQLSSEAGGEDSDALWAPRTGAIDRFVSREELFRFCLKHIDAFLGAPAEQQQFVVDQLRAAGFEELALQVATALLERDTMTAAASKHQQTSSSSSSSSSAALPSRQKLVAELVPAFKNMADVRAAVQSVLSSFGKDGSAVRGYILELLETMAPPERQLQQQQQKEKDAAAAAAASQKSGNKPLTFANNPNLLFEPLAAVWPAAYPKLATALLTNPAVAEALYKTISGAQLAAGTAHTRKVAGPLQSPDVRDKLRRLVDLDIDIKERAAALVKKVRFELLSDSGNLSACARMLIRVRNVKQQQKQQQSSESELIALVRSRVAQATAEAQAPQWLLKTVVEKVAADFPTWTSNGSIIMPEDLSGDYQKLAAAMNNSKHNKASSSSSSSSYVSTDQEALFRHALLLRIFLRLTYVPHAANAVLKSRHRRRIGQIATKPHQFNVDAEVGFAEEYNTKEHKQWDWQGWYQRMMDIFHRNVSLRVRVDDLRGRVDNGGRPFLSMQAERRLRILAEKRVGGGVLKLDNDRFEDQSDNLDYGTGKLQQLLSEAKKAQLGREYWPSVEVKVREPSGQSRLHYSLLDWERVEAKADEMLDRYTKAKERSVYVPPTATWLEVGGGQGAQKTAAATVDAEGYTVDASGGGGARK